MGRVHSITWSLPSLYCLISSTPLCSFFHLLFASHHAFVFSPVAFSSSSSIFSLHLTHYRLLPFTLPSLSPVSSYFLHPFTSTCSCFFPCKLNSSPPCVFSTSSNLPRLPSSCTCLTTSLVYLHAAPFPYLCSLATCLPHLSRPPSSRLSSSIFLPSSHFLIASSPRPYPAILVKSPNVLPSPIPRSFPLLLHPFFPPTTAPPLYSSLSRSRTPCSWTRQRIS